MPLSKSKRKQQQAEDYDTNSRLKRNFHSEKDTRILKSHCDFCNDELSKEADNIEYRINVLDEIDDSFESEYDKTNQGYYSVPFAARSTIFQVTSDRVYNQLLLI